MPKYEVTSGGHMVKGAFYPRGSFVELEEKEANKFKNAFKLAPPEVMLTAPQPINPEDLTDVNAHVQNPAMAPATEQAGIDPRDDKKPQKPADSDAEDLPGEDSTEAFVGASDLGLKVFQKDDGGFVVRGEDGDTEFAEADEVTAHVDSLAAEDKPKKKATKKHK